jgi:mannose-6-phosphate isomerase-like protein (cupin superfamily)
MSSVEAVETFYIPARELRAERSANAFAGLLREEGDDIRRDVFVLVQPEASASGRIMSGYTVIYPGCRTRGHAHADREEVYHFVRGNGVMVVDGVETPVTAGDSLYLKPGPFHTTRNDADLPLEYFWTTIRVD